VETEQFLVELFFQDFSVERFQLRHSIDVGIEVIEQKG